MATAVSKIVRIVVDLEDDSTNLIATNPLSPHIQDSHSRIWRDKPPYPMPGQKSQLRATCMWTCAIRFHATKYYF